MRYTHECSSFTTSTISSPRPQSSPCSSAISTPTSLRLYPFRTSHLFDKNISTKESSASRTTHRPALCGNQLIVRVILKRCSAHRLRITSNIATVMFWFAWAQVRQRFTLRTGQRVTSFWHPHFSSHPT